MPLSPLWWENSPSAPFRDNTNGEITAGTFRSFAEAVSVEGVSADWFEYTSAAPNLAAPYVWTSPSLSEVLWLQSGGTGRISDNWEISPTTDGQSVFMYSGGVPALTQVTFNGTVEASGVRSGTVVSPVIWLGDLPDNLDSSAAVAVGPETELVSDPVDISASSVLFQHPVNGVALAFGLRFRPPSGQAIEDGTFGVDLSGLMVRAVARPAAPTSSIS